MLETEDMPPQETLNSPQEASDDVSTQDVSAVQDDINTLHKQLRENESSETKQQRLRCEQESGDLHLFDKIKYDACFECFPQTKQRPSTFLLRMEAVYTPRIIDFLGALVYFFAIVCSPCIDLVFDGSGEQCRYCWHEISCAKHKNSDLYTKRSEAKINWGVAWYLPLFAITFFAFFWIIVDLLSNILFLLLVGFLLACVTFGVESLILFKNANKVQ